MKRATILRLAASLALPALLALPLAAQDERSDQQSDRQSTFFDTVEVYVVNVEVVVTHRDGSPARGLQREDFELYEDGERVEVSNFFAVEGRETVSARRGDPPLSVLPGLMEPETKRLNLIVFIDNFNMRPEGRNQIFDDLRTFLVERLDTRDRVMLVTMNDTIEVAHGFSNDPGALLDTIDRLEKEVGSHVQWDAQRRMLLRQMQRARLPPGPGGADFEAAVSTAESMAVEVRILVEQRSQRVRATVQALERFTESLAGMRGRKAMVYVSDGLPVRSGDALSRAWTNKFENWILFQRADLQTELTQMTLMAGSAEYDATGLLDDLAVKASANQVTFYPISNSGQRAGSQISAEFRGSGTTSGAGPLSADVAAIDGQSLDSSLLILARGTGGVAFTGTANIGGLLERLVHDFDSFYSLGYSPSHRADSEFHHIEVKLVNRQDLTVRHLQGYRTKDAVADLQDRILTALHYDLEDNRHEVMLEPGEQTPADKGRFHVPVLVKIPLKNLLLLPEDESHQAQVSIFVVVRDGNTGGVSPFQRIDLPITIPNDRILQALTQEAGYQLQLNMKRGPKRITIGLRDHIANQNSTVSLDLEVGGE